MTTSTMIRFGFELYFSAGLFFAGAKWMLMQQDGIFGWDLIKGTVSSLFLYPIEIMKSFKGIEL